MPRIVAAAAAALLLSLAPTASASIWPAPMPAEAVPAGAVSVHGAGRAPHREQARTCTKSARVMRWLAPVACEHPPRSETLVVPLLGG